MNKSSNINLASSLIIPQFCDDPYKATFFYMENGFHIEKDVWSETDINEINEEADKIQAETDGNFSTITHGDRKSDVILKSAKNTKIIAIVENFVRGRIAGLQTVYSFNKPGTKGFQLHQDNFYIRTHRDMFVSAWSPMVDVNQQNGCLIVYPGSHKEPILEVKETKSCNGLNQPLSAECILPDNYVPLAIDAPKGACVFLHSQIAHSSYDNISDQYRRTFLTTYIKDGATFQTGKTGRKRIPLYE